MTSPHVTRLGNGRAELRTQAVSVRFRRALNYLKVPALVSKVVRVGCWGTSGSCGVEYTVRNSGGGVTVRAGDRDLGVPNTADPNHIHGLGRPGNENRRGPWMDVKNSSCLRNQFRKKSPGKEAEKSQFRHVEL